jgi:RNA polymerase sigma-70 factor (ECF subfamily)
VTSTDAAEASDGTFPGRTHPRRSSAIDERSADLDAIARCRAGDREAFGEIVERWQDRIFGAALRMVRDAETARDLAQETFVRAYVKLESFEGGAAFGTWLYAICVNQVRGEMRKRSAQKRGDAASLDALRESADVDPADPSDDPEARASTKEQCARLSAELERLDPEHREVVLLREFEDLSYEEIADVVGVPVGTVRSRLFRAREELRDRMREAS